MKPTTEVRDKLIQATKADARNCASVCKEYTIMANAYEPLMWFVRYTKVAWEGGHARQFYRWLCFDKEGYQVDCDPVFGSAEKENIFKEAMIEIEQLENVFV